MKGFFIYYNIFYLICQVFIRKTEVFLNLRAFLRDFVRKSSFFNKNRGNFNKINTLYKLLYANWGPFERG